MGVNIYRAARQSGLLFMMVLVWIAAPDYVSGRMLYKYIDEEGTYVITDNPPPEYTLIPDTPPDVMEEKKMEMEREKKDVVEKTHTVRDAGAERQERIRTAKYEVEQALAREENYRLNMQAATTYNQRLYWREMWDRQKKVVEETKQKLDEVIRLP